VIDNLLANAIKYSPTGGEITVRLACEERDGVPWAILAVEDNGVGIPAADLPHIFEHFRRGSNVLDRIAGTGLGLAGSRRIVAQHGGDMTIVSHEGVGTTVTVALPMARPPATDRETDGGAS
jgi:signal transduction histidine kinase